MKTTYRIEKVNAAKEMHVSFDVSKVWLDMRIEIPDVSTTLIASVTKVMEERIANRSHVIRTRMRELKEIAAQLGYEGGVRVICEATGGFEQKLLCLARQEGCKTSYADGEAVNKAKIIDHNDTGKSDQQDPAVMLTLARMGKIKAHRILPPAYKKLHILGRMYTDEENNCRILRCKLHWALRNIFVDFSKDKAFIFGHSGETLIELFQANPFTIMAKGFKAFCRAMKKKQPHIRQETLDQLWRDAESSVLHQMPPDEIDLMQEQFLTIWKRYQQASENRASLRERLEKQYTEMQAREALPKPSAAFLSIYCLARIIGETGPLTDFSSIQSIQKFAGLNLCRRQSGTHEGKIKVSRKGSAPLRYVLAVATLSLVRKGSCYGEYYHDPKRKDKPGLVRMTAIKRKLLGTIWVLGIKHVEFDQKRLQTCEAQYKKAA